MTNEVRWNVVQGMIMMKILRERVAMVDGSNV